MKIERGIPLPEDTAQRKGNHATILRRMLVGDSILVLHPSTMNRVAVMCAYLKEKEGKRFTRRKQPDGAVRVWRTD